MPTEEGATSARRDPLQGQPPHIKQWYYRPQGAATERADATSISPTSTDSGTLLPPATRIPHPQVLQALPSTASEQITVDLSLEADALRDLHIHRRLSAPDINRPIRPSSHVAIQPVSGAAIARRRRVTPTHAIHKPSSSSKHSPNKLGPAAAVIRNPTGNRAAAQAQVRRASVNPIIILDDDDDAIDERSAIALRKQSVSAVPISNISNNSRLSANPFTSVQQRFRRSSVVTLSSSSSSSSSATTTATTPMTSPLSYKYTAASLPRRASVPNPAPHVHLHTSPPHGIRRVSASVVESSATSTTTHGHGGIKHVRGCPKHGPRPHPINNITSPQGQAVYTHEQAGRLMHHHHHHHQHSAHHICKAKARREAPTSAAAALAIRRHNLESAGMEYRPTASVSAHPRAEVVMDATAQRQIHAKMVQHRHVHPWVILFFFCQSASLHGFVSSKSAIVFSSLWFLE
jgi:hypothetical protein